MVELIIAANWKMHKTTGETSDFCRAILKEEKLFSGVEILICPPYTSLPAAANIIVDSSLKLGAQDLHWEKEGAFTGEISGAMLADLGVEYVLVGHSERRHILGEDNNRISSKVKAALDCGLKPILCVGETEAEREAGATNEVIEEQLISALKALSAGKIGDLVVAYEPVWAIGTGKAALPSDAEAACLFITEALQNIAGPETVKKTRIQYGGSVKEGNIGSFVEQTSIHGALVGGASLKADSFSKLVHAARKAVQS